MEKLELVPQQGSLLTVLCLAGPHRRRFPAVAGGVSARDQDRLHHDACARDACACHSHRPLEKDMTNRGWAAGCI